MRKSYRIKMKDVAYSSIRAKIISGEIPPGASLSEESMAQDLGISRTPIREAILMLEADDLVRIYPNKGPVVTDLNLDDLIWITQIREGLEGIAARIACDRADKEKLLEIKHNLLQLTDLQDEEQRELSFKYGREIHDIIIYSTENKRMIKIVENMTLHLNRLMIISRLAPQRAEITYEQHLAIIDAIIEKNYDEAERRIRNHIKSVSNDAIKIHQQEYR